jgi:hypothetical protein
MLTTCKWNHGVARWRRKFSRLNVLFVTHIFIGSSTLNVSIYSENRRGIYFSPAKRLKHGRQNITLHWINGIIRNNKCIFNKLNAVFYTQNGCMNNKNITTVNSVTNTWSIQQTPMFHGCTITNKQNVEPWKLSTSWSHTMVLFTFCCSCSRFEYKKQHLIC